MRQGRRYGLSAEQRTDIWRRMEDWSVRTLRARIDSMLYERTALSRKAEELARKELAILKRSGEVGPALVLKDSYILDFF